MATQQNSLCALAHSAVLIPGTTENNNFLDAFNAASPDTLYMCGTCHGAHIDPYETPRHTVGGWNTCQDCIASCPLCGEWMDDTLPAEGGPPVRYRAYEDDGKLSAPTCAACAAGWLVELWADDRNFWTEHATREEITAAVANFTGKAVAA